MTFRTVNRFATSIVPFIALTATALPLAAHAQRAPADQLNYNYVDATHFPEAKIDHGNFDVDGHGWQLRGSLGFSPIFFGFADFQSLSLDDGVDSRRAIVGGGAHWPIANNVDVVGRLGVVNYKIDTRGPNDDDTGVFIGARVRAIVFPKVEVEGGVEHQHVSAFDLKNDTYLVGEARYNFTPQLSAGVTVNAGGDTEMIGAQARFSF